VNDQGDFHAGLDLVLSGLRARLDRETSATWRRRHHRCRRRQRRPRAKFSPPATQDDRARPGTAVIARDRVLRAARTRRCARAIPTPTTSLTSSRRCARG